MNSTAMTLKIIFSAPGHVRFRLAPEAKKNPDLDSILTIPGVKETSFNKLTKSLLIVYNHKVLTSQKLIEALKEKLPKLRIIKKVKHQKEIKKGLPSHQIYKLFKQINKNVLVKTKGQTDIFSSVLVISLVWGIEELIRKPVIPKWYDILRFSQSLFTEIEIEEEM